MKTTVEPYVGLRCNCFYKGSIYECEVTDLTRSRGHLRCRITKLGIEVNIMRYNVNWQCSPEVEEQWLDKQEERNDRTARMREVRQDAKHTVMERVTRKKEDRYKSGDAAWATRKMSSTQALIHTISAGKNEQVLQALCSRLQNLCRVGSRAVSHMLNSFHRSGDEYALLFRLALEMERIYLCICREKRPISIGHNLQKLKELCVQLIDRCRKAGIGCGYPNGNKDVVCLLIPDCEPIVIPVKEWGVVPGYIPSIAHEWDGKHRMNIRRLEEGISRRYGCWLRWKYPERFSESA